MRGECFLNILIFKVLYCRMFTGNTSLESVVISRILKPPYRALKAENVGTIIAKIGWEARKLCYVFLCFLCFPFYCISNSMQRMPNKCTCVGELLWRRSAPNSSGGIKSTENHCGSFTARFSQKYHFCCRTIFCFPLYNNTQFVDMQRNHLWAELYWTGYTISLLVLWLVNRSIIT